MAIAWLPGPAGTRRRVAKLSVEEPDAAEPARPDLWGARVSNDPGATPTTGWHRLRLLRQIGDQLVSGVEQFLLINNVVTVEDGPALVAGQEHGDPLGDVRADEVARGGAAAVVKEAGRHPSGLAGGAPRCAPAPDGDAVAVEDERAVGVAACLSVSNSSSGRRWKLDHAPAVGDPTHMVEFGTGRRAFAREA